eukprot:6208267-Pleurochrysis_carterae.AAC.11
MAGKRNKQAEGYFLCGFEARLARSSNRLAFKIFTSVSRAHNALRPRDVRYGHRHRAYVGHKSCSLCFALCAIHDRNGKGCAEKFVQEFRK